MARATFLWKDKLHIDELHGYAIQGLFGLKGFEDNFRIHLATRAEVGTENRLKWTLPKGAVNRPVAQLDLVLSDDDSYYSFKDITLLNRYRLVNGAERYHIFECGYVGKLAHGKKTSDNPLVLDKAKFKMPVGAHHSGQTVLISGKAKPLLGTEDLQDAQAATVVRMVSHRTTENSWLDLLNKQNWKPKVADRLKWNFTLNNNKYEVDGEIDNQTVIHYRETYGVFNLAPNPELAGYTEQDLTRHCLSLPVAALRPSAPMTFVDAQQTVKDQQRFAELVLHSFIETVTVKFAPGRYHHLDLG